ncbi:Beta-galactosidase C-terminal domain [Glycomyces sp. NPDC049804]|uniref:Beta-galactosidase C-terminal domain n=1 Tax=Glycomyces sp. NPDC049804 TaxID=3154363 RepID=UPI003447661A
MFSGRQVACDCQSSRLADLDPFLADLGVGGDFPDAAAGLELVRRSHPDGRTYVFAINHGNDPVEFPRPAATS